MVVFAVGITFEVTGRGVGVDERSECATLAPLRFTALFCLDRFSPSHKDSEADSKLPMDDSGDSSLKSSWAKRLMKMNRTINDHGSNFIFMHLRVSVSP